MAMTGVQTPQIITPAYNPVVFTVDSTNINVPSFRYIFEVYRYTVGSPSEVLVGKFKVAPEPNTGYGYIDLSKILSDLVTFDFEEDTVSTAADNSIVEYRVEVSEEYLYSWDFTSISWNPGDGYFTLHGASTPIWTINNSLTIDIASGDTWADGLHVALGNSLNKLDVFGEYGGSGTATGTVYWANRTKTVSAVLLTYDNYFVWNGVRTTASFLDFDYTDYAIPQSPVNTTRFLLTDQPEEFYMTRDQDLWLGVIKDPVNAVSVRIKFVNDNGDVFSGNAWSSALNSQMSHAPAGPNNALTTTLESGTFPLIKSDTKYYDVWLYTAASNQLTRKYRIFIDDRCKIEDYEICFLDRMGTFSSFAFQLRSKETGSVERGQYNKFLGEVGVSGWSYDSKDAGNTNYYVSVSKQLELNTNWMTDDMSVYFDQLVTSPVTFIKKDGQYLACTVTDGGFETLRQRNKNLIRRTVTVRFANNDTINI